MYTTLVFHSLPPFSSRFSSSIIFLAYHIIKQKYSPIIIHILLPATSPACPKCATGPIAPSASTKLPLTLHPPPQQLLTPNLGITALTKMVYFERFYSTRSENKPRADRSTSQDASETTNYALSKSSRMKENPVGHNQLRN